MRCVLMAALLSLATPAFADEFDNMMKTLNSRPVPKQLAGTVNQSAASASDVARFFSSAYDRLRTVGHVIKHPVDSVKEAAKTASKKALCAQAGASGKDCPADLLEPVIDHPGNSHDDQKARAQSAYEYMNGRVEDSTSILQDTTKYDNSIADPESPDYSPYYKDQYPDKE